MMLVMRIENMLIWENPSKYKQLLLSISRHIVTFSRISLCPPSRDVHPLHSFSVSSIKAHAHPITHSSITNDASVELNKALQAPWQEEQPIVSARWTGQVEDPEHSLFSDSTCLGLHPSKVDIKVVDFPRTASHVGRVHGSSPRPVRRTNQQPCC